MGYDYITVSGKTANAGISTMSTSGGDDGTAGVVTYRLEWTVNGFTGVSWLFGRSGNKVEDWWQENYEKLGYSTVTADEFSEYVRTQNNLDHVFSTWDDNLKYNFLILQDEFGYDPETGVFDRCVTVI